MKAFLSAVFLLFTAGFAQEGCEVPSLPAREPFSGNAVCISRQEPRTLTILTESECGPCKILLGKLLEVRRSKKTPVSIQLVWLDTDFSSCTASSTRYRVLGTSVCASALEVKHRWKREGSPFLFYRRGEELVVLEGHSEKRDLGSLWDKVALAQ